MQRLHPLLQDWLPTNTAESVKLFRIGSHIGQKATLFLTPHNTLVMFTSFSWLNNKSVGNNGNMFGKIFQPTTFDFCCVQSINFYTRKIRHVFWVLFAVQFLWEHKKTTNCKSVQWRLTFCSFVVKNEEDKTLHFEQSILKLIPNNVRNDSHLKVKNDLKILIS